MSCFELQPFYFIVVDLSCTHLIQCTPYLCSCYCFGDGISGADGNRPQYFSLRVWTIFQNSVLPKYRMHVESAVNETVVRISHTHTHTHTHIHTHDERVDISFFLKKVCSFPVFQFLKNICLSFLSCVFSQHVFCTIHRKILFGRFSQNEACFWKWLPQIFVKKQYNVYFKCLCIIVTYYGS